MRVRSCARWQDELRFVSGATGPSGRLRMIGRNTSSDTRLYKSATLHMIIVDNGPAPGVGDRETIALPPVRESVMPQSGFTPTAPKPIDHPLCRSAMSLCRIVPDKLDHDRRTFECTQCKHEVVLVVKYQ